MKSVLPVALSAFIVAGCSTADFDKVANDTMNAGLHSVMSSAGISSSSTPTRTSSTNSGDTRTDAVSGSNISILDASRTKRDFGKVKVVKTEKNPNGQTRLILDGCSNPRVGGVRCSGYLYEVTENGWLVDRRIQFNDNTYSEIVVAAGAYYLKFSSDGHGYRSYTTGEFKVTPFVSNHVAVEME